MPTDPTIGTMLKGRIKFFNSTKGFGFIVPATPLGNNEEVFVHYTSIHNNGGFKSLAENEEVEFECFQTNKGYQASKVTGPGGVVVRGDPRVALSQSPQIPATPTLYHNTPQQLMHMMPLHQIVPAAQSIPSWTPQMGHSRHAVYAPPPHNTRVKGSSIRTYPNQVYSQRGIPASTTPYIQPYHHHLNPSTMPFLSHPARPQLPNNVQQHHPYDLSRSSSFDFTHMCHEINQLARPIAYHGAEPASSHAHDTASEYIYSPNSMPMGVVGPGFVYAMSASPHHYMQQPSNAHGTYQYDEYHHQPASPVVNGTDVDESCVDVDSTLTMVSPTMSSNTDRSGNTSHRGSRKGSVGGLDVRRRMSSSDESVVVKTATYVDVANETVAET
ncbi:hypothetical protein SeMB42_g02499 [Synchytrium endobioticum]|uniref:CSD domain-containing protein n=1 Tax=Synchytrium endobioticum TaxID=286115 RepID=A0A507DDF9_9FUNG|nr:hypothetical protein SeLEV6574_g02279 [Synchytrium endobioticum]TPX49722.1 hypothetical protein SeMB42_g02499 [Synchytrium endobioticum]